jgi:hypothetical protein
VIEANKVVWHSLLFVVVLMAGRSLEGASAKPHQVDSSASNQQVQTTVVSSYGPRWKISDGYTTALVLKNSGRSSATALVTLYSASGTPAGSTQVKIAASDSTRLSLSDIVSSDSPVAEGGLSVQWAPSAQSLSGRVLITDPSGGTISYAVQGGYRYDTENTLSTSWWTSDVGTVGTLTLFNSSSRDIVVSPSVTVNRIEKSGEAILITANSSQELQLSTLLQQAGVGWAATGSITLGYTGSPHALQPAFSLSNTHRGFSLGGTFNATRKRETQTLSPVLQRQTTWQFPYVATAQQQHGTAFETEPLTAYALLTNKTTTQMVFQMTAHAVGDGQVQEGSLTVPTLQPQETRLLNLSELVPQISPQATRMAITISHLGQPGDLNVSIFSVSPRNEVMSLSEGMILPASEPTVSFWDVSGARLLLHHIKSTNGGNASATATLYYQTPSGLHSYNLPAVLTADGNHETTINLLQIIRMGVHDSNGATIPVGVDSGLIVLSPGTAKSGSFAGMNLATCLTDCRDQVEEAQSTQSSSAIAFVNSPKPLCTSPPPPPSLTITNISPSPLAIGSTGVMTITGSGFSGKGTPSLKLSGTGITLGTPSVVSDSSMQATYTVACSASSQELTAVFPSDDNAGTNAFTVGIGLPAAPAPQVMFGGKNVIGTTSSAVVGQQIALSASTSLPTCMSLQSQQWTAPTGTAVGGYTNAAGTGKPDSTGGKVQPLPNSNAASFTFYWTAAGNPLSVSYSYTMTNGSGSVTSSPVTANFNIAGPTNVTVFTCGGTVTGPCSSNGPLGKVVINNGPQLQFGNVTTNTNVGIQFSASATAPSGSTNTFQWVQIITADTMQLTGCAVLNCHPQVMGGSIPGLDTEYLYGTGVSVNDNPSIGLSPIYTEVSRNFAATMYVMWSSGLTNSIPVPLGSVSWGFSGDATLSNVSKNQWTLKPGAAGNNSPFQSSTSYAQWTAWVPYNGKLSCSH